MGRPYTGADTTARAPRLYLSTLLKGGMFAKDRTISARLEWNPDEWCEITSVNTKDERHMDLTTHYLDHNDEPRTTRQRIYMARVPSNLGKGTVLYFYCPHTGKRCRVLYRAYHADGFRSRGAFRRRLFYPLQAQSGFTRHSQREVYTEARLEKLYAMRATSTHKGKPTRRALRIAALEAKLGRLNALGWTPAMLPKVLREY